MLFCNTLICMRLESLATHNLPSRSVIDLGGSQNRHGGGAVQCHTVTVPAQIQKMGFQTFLSELLSY